MRKLYLLLVFMGFSLAGYAQETSCTDGIDNDGDGFIDCFDSDCGGSVVCDGTYIGNDTECEIPQPPGSDFSMTLENETDEHVASTHGRFVIGDMGDPVNGKDGIPEIVTAHTSDKKIYILDGQTLEIKYEATSPNRIDRYDIAIADVTNTGCAQIFVAEVGTERVCTRYRSNGSCADYDDVTKHYVSSWDCQANFLWRTEAYARPFTLALADFDADGKAELYFRNQILDAETGQVLVAGSGDWGEIDGGPVAVDILDDSECADCEGLELVAGGEIYSVGLNAPGVIDGGTLTLVREFNDIPGLTGNNYWHTKFLDLDNDKFVNSQTSIADFDLDGYLDVLMTGTSNGGKTTVFYWNVRKNTADVYRPANNWKYGAGRLNLADLDGDGQMNVAFVSGNYIYALDENLDLLWRKGIDEQSSGYTSTTVFDFNNDGASEIVYRDETYLYIIKGDGTFSPGIPCKSLTSNDYPIVADVDADGSTEICVICQDDFNKSNYFGANEGVIRTYKSGNEPWVSSRKVWNQHGYFNVNVNDDLTIPKVQQKHHVVFSENKCGEGENRVLNSFLNQSAILNTDGCKTYPSADVSFLPNPDLLNIVPPTCPDQDFLVSFTIRNIGSLDLTADIPISFYNGDPRFSGAVKLSTQIVKVANFKKGDQLEVSDLAVTGTGGAFTLYAVLNDAGTSIPISLPNSGIEECNLGNNVASASVNPQAFRLTTTSTDQIQCGATPSAPNGTVKAYKLEGAVEQTIGYTFYWFDGTTAGAPGSADHTGSEITNLSNGTYTVYAKHDAYQCGSDTVQVAVALQSLSIGATINVDQPYTNCNVADGQLSVTPDSGDPDDYTYQWFEGTVFGTSPTLSTTNILPSTKALTYSVLITDKASNCETLESGTVPDLTVTPDVTASFTPANCLPANSGQASATVGGAIAGYTFYWYDGTTSKPTEDFLGATYANIATGSYTVVAKDNNTGCVSDETLVTVSSVAGITVTANVTAPQTSCVTPNGAVSAHVGGVTAGYTFEWFAGNNTSNGIGTGAVMTGLAAGDYTVRATNTATGCFDTALITVSEDVRIPTASASVVSHQTACAPPNGAVSATAAGSPGPYVYYWFDGNVGTPDTAAADFKGKTYSGLVAGFYTVLAVDAKSRCGAARAVVEVRDQTVTPPINTITVPQTSCNTLAPNGSASVDVNGATAGYAFRWFNGADTSNFRGPGAAIAQLAAGTYTVKATYVATGCFSTKQITISNSFVYPVAAAAVDQHVTLCNAANGQVSANVGGATNGFDFYWFNGNPAAPDSAAANFKGSVYGNRPVGAYTAIAVNKVTRCISARRTVTVLDHTVPPAIATVSVPQTSCNALTPNGGASANVGGTTAGYAFRWFNGTDTASFITQGASLADRTAGTYTVKAINLATGCVSTRQVTIANNFVNPVVGAVVDQHLTLCNADNGQVSANVGGVINGFDFYWFNGNPAAADSTAANFKGAVYANRPVGAYTVIAVKKGTRCISAKRTVTVLDNTTPPVITTTTAQQTSCNSLTPNGAATASVGGATDGYRFRWFAGADTSAFITENPVLSNRVAGTYTVKAIDVAAGCFSVARVTISNNFVNPVVAALVDQHLTACNASNGQVSANVSGATNGFDFYWFNGNPGAPDSTAANFKGAVYANRPVGAYTVIAVNKGTRCISAKRTVTVLDHTTPPVIATATVQQTSCNSLTPNGQASADVGGTTLGYRFRWFNGADTTLFIQEDPVLTNRASGTYTVKAINITTGCFTTKRVTITNNFVSPVVAAAIDQHLTVCNASNGQVSANVGGATNGFDFYWFNGSAASDSSAASFKGAVYANRPAGAFTVIAVNKVTRCVSVKNTVTVLDNSVPPTVTATSPDDNTACLPTNANGSIAADVAGVTTDHTFHVFRGQNTNPANEVAGSPSATVTGLTAGIYTVMAVDNTTGCHGMTEVTVNDNIVLPTLNATSVDVTDCSPSNGVVTAGVSIGAVSDYTFTWYNGDGLKATTDYPGETSESLTGLAAGTYTVTAFNNLLGCDVEDPVVVDVVNDPNTDVTVNSVPADMIPGAVCNDGTGQLGAQAFSPVNTTGFVFSWYAGDKNSGMTFAGNGTVVTSVHNRISSISSGRYTVIARDNDTGCQDSAVIDLPYLDEALLVHIVTAPQTNCAAPDGSFRAEITPGPAAIALGADQTYYQLEVWQDNVLLQSVPGVNPATTISGLAAGDYTVVAREVHPSLPGCKSTPNDIVIADATVHPVLVSTLTDNKNCTTTPTGSVSIDVDGGADPLDYAFDWHQGKRITDPALPAANVPAPANAAINIGNGFYSVQVVNNATGCETVETYHIKNDPYVISILNADLALTHQTDCSPPNGLAEVTDVQVDGASIGTGGFTYAWFENDGTTAIPLSGTNALIGAQLAAGDYYVQATNTLSGCQSTLKQFKVLNQTLPPSIALSASSDNTNCTGVTPNGSLTIEVNGGDPLADFTINWFEGTGTATPLGTNFGNAVGANGETAADLPAGSYTVEVIDNTTPGNTCSATSTFTIVDDLPVIGIDVPDIAVTDQTNCSPVNGSAEVTDILVNGVAIGSVAGFTFDWLEGDGATAIAGAGNTAAIGAALGAGDYYVRAIRTASNCISSVTPFQVKDVHVDPVITLSVQLDNTHCPGATPNGSLTIEVNGGDPLADFTINWFEGTGTATPLGTNFGAIAGTNRETAANLPAGTYTVEVIDNTTPGNTCSATSTFTIVDDVPVIGIDVPDITVMDQTNCSPVNGSTEVTDILVNGVAIGSVAGFTFDWLESDGATAIVGSGNTATIGAALGADDYYVRAIRTASNCISSVTPFRVQDVHVDPVITLAAQLDNTHCAGALPNGSLTVSVDGGSPLADYTINWFEGSGTATPLGTNFGVMAGTNGQTAANLPAGTYTVEVIDNATPGNTCSATSVFTIADDLPVIGIDNASVAVTHQTNCSPVNGSAEVTDVLINGVSAGIAGFTFEWLENDGTTPVAVAGNSAIPGAPLGAGDYFVRATNAASGCVSQMTSVSVDDIHVDPVIDLTALVNNANCAGSPANGSLTIGVNGGEALANFAITWFEGTGTATPLGTNVGSISGTHNETAMDLPAGTYTVLVTDQTTPGNTCAASATFTIADDLPVIGIDNADVVVTHQTDCVPGNGSAMVTEVTLNGVGAGTVTGYTFEWLAADGVTPIAGAGTAATVGVPLAPATYVVRAVNVASSCTSSPTALTVVDKTAVPAADIAMVQPNIGCDLVFTGELAASVAEGTTPGITTGYTFDWFRGKGNIAPVDFIASGPGLSDLAQGDYTVRVTDTATPGMGCVAVATLPVVFEKTQISTALNSVMQVHCAPAADGSLTVNTVTETIAGTTTTYDMATADRTRFDFQWFDDDGTAHASTPDFVNGANALGNLAAGAYTIKVRNTLGCVSTETAALVDDQTAPPVITLDDYGNPAICLLPETEGFLQVSADNSLNFANYTFEWFEGADATGTVITNNPTLANIGHSEPRQYAIRVTNNATHCVSTEAYRFSVDTLNIQVLASAVARTNCVTDDGSLFATTLNGTAVLYQYAWYQGASATGTPIYTTREVSGAPIGQYTVVAMDPNHSVCVSSPYTTEVRDGRVLPALETIQRNPLTYCDPAKPNGVAYASVNNGVSGYTFEWFHGSVGGAPFRMGPEVKGLAAATYVVRATNVLTGCEQTGAIVIENNPVDVPEPTVLVVSHLTNCVVPDGILSASVNGNIANYFFQWYNGKSVRPAADATGEFYRDLKDGHYTTTATDNVSGCVSDPVVTEVLPFQENPDFDIIVKPTNCEQDIGEASIVMLNEVPLSSVEWNINGLYEEGHRLSGLPKGEFTVTVTTYRQCAETKTFTILPEVLVFNGVSRNNDGQNDIFEIACIQDFPHNNVKIFNRAGTLVYEANGYDNQDVVFDGVSNRGINLLGTELPDGTYFYIIDKRNGSKPSTGYLELLR